MTEQATSLRIGPRRRVVEDHVSGAVHAFFGPRWVLLLAARATRAGRKEFRRRLTGEVDVRPGCATQLDGEDEAEVLRMLTARGAPECCVLVKDGLLEDEITTLRSALHRVLLGPEGALVSCIPGRLAFLQCDGGGRRLLLMDRA